MSETILSSAAGRSNKNIDIEGRAFKAKRATANEALDLIEAGQKSASLDSQRESANVIAEALVPILNKRAQDSEPVTAAWLLDECDFDILSALMTFFTTGKVEQTTGGEGNAAQTGNSSTPSSEVITDSRPTTSAAS